jgi:hypothetical protein
VLVQTGMVNQHSTAAVVSTCVHMYHSEPVAAITMTRWYPAVMVPQSRVGIVWERGKGPSTILTVCQTTQVCQAVPDQWVDRMR